MVDTTPFPEWTGTDGGESDGVWIDRYVSKDYKLDLWESSTSEIVYVSSPNLILATLKSNLYRACQKLPTRPLALLRTTGPPGPPSDNQNL